MLKLKIIKVNWRKLCVCSNQNKMVGGKAGDTISKLRAIQATKNGLVNRAAKPLGVQ